MKRISTGTKAVAYILSAALALGICGFSFMTRTPGPLATSPIPAADYDNIKMFEPRELSALKGRNNPFKIKTVKVKTPKIKDLKKAEAKAITVEVLGTLPPDVAVIRENSGVRTVTTGDRTSFGTLEAVDAGGIYISSPLAAEPRYFELASPTAPKPAVETPAVPAVDPAVDKIYDAQAEKEA